MTKEEILAELKSINDLEFAIEKRMREGTTAVKDSDGVELTKKAIDKRVRVLARDLMARYPDANPLLVTVLDGALPFAADMHNALSRRGYSFNFSSITASSYGASMSSSGCDVLIGAMPKMPVAGRTVIIVDEVYDTGKTCAALRDKFTQAGAIGVAVLVLIDKKQPRPEWGDPEFAGFQIDPRPFIVGKGLDYAGMLRNEPSIRAVDVSTLPTPEEQLIRARKQDLINALQMLKRNEPIPTIKARTSPRFSLSGSVGSSSTRLPHTGSSGSSSPRTPSGPSPHISGFFSNPDSPGFADAFSGLLFGPGQESKGPGV